MKIILLLIIFLSVGFGESFWRGEKAGLFDDHYAKRIGDSITVVVIESVSSKQKSNSSLDNANKFEVGPGSGYAGFLASKTSVPNASSFKASGESVSEGELKTEVTVKVKEVQTNGELVIFGNRITNINGDTQIIEISGIVRPESIMEGNRVFSTALADARITYSQAGELKNNAEPGLVTKLFNLFF